MTIQLTGSILVIISTLIVATGFLLLFTISNFIKIIFWRSSTKSGMVRFLEIKRVTYKARESVMADDVKIWTPRQHRQ